VQTLERTLTTTEAAVLALLAIEGEQTPYRLAAAVEDAIGHVWSPARSGLFATLPRLANDGLAYRRGRLYRISSDGRAALDAWQRTVEPGARETFFLKLFVGGLTTPDVLLEHVEQFADDVDERLERYRALARTNSNEGHDWYHRLLLDHAIMRAEQELDWAAAVARKLRRK
jgi:DNA-binding PadR family transcriptional regulator